MEEERKTILSRAYYIYVLTFLFGVAVLGKVLYIQIIEGPELRKKADKLNYSLKDIDAMRGNIYSSDGMLLAVSVPVFNIFMDVSAKNLHDSIFKKGVDSLALGLSKIFNEGSKAIHKQKIMQARKENKQYTPVKKNVSYDQLKKLRTLPLFRYSRYGSALIAEPAYQRELPFKSLAKRTIGWDKQGATKNIGLEGAYNEVLKGVSGKQLTQRIGKSDWRPLHDKNDVEPRNGQDIISSINVMIQDVAHDALTRELQANEAEQGCVVLMEVETGFINAIVNLQLTSEGTYEERYNFAIGHSSDPGSTFKLASMLAAFEDNVVDLNDSIETGNGITKYEGLKIEDSRRGGHGTITVQHVFEVSSNVGISKIITSYYKDKPQQFINHLYKMSLGKQTGIELPGEGQPVVKSTNNPTWWKTTLPMMSIGYEVDLTPLQILTFYNAVANNGKMMKPLFVKEITEAGKTIEKFNPVVINPSVASRQSIEKAKEMLKGVVENGTAQNLKNTDYKIAGKTGTAQVLELNKGYSKKDYNASFVGYFPANNPKYSMIVVISKPRKADFYFGSQIAAPVFREIADKVYANSLDIQPETVWEPDTIVTTRNIAGKRSDLIASFQHLNIPISNQGYGEWVYVSFNSDTAKINNRKIHHDKIPNVIGMSARDATFIMEKLGLRVNIDGMGVVRSQFPDPGSDLKQVEEITLLLTI